MRTSTKIVISSILAGLLLWVIDAWVDYLFFSQTESIWNSLIFNLSGHELYFRLFFLVSFIIFGIVISRIISKQQDLKLMLEQVTTDWEETFNSITDMITIHDRDFNIIRANKAAGELLRLPSPDNKLHLKCYQGYHGKEAPPSGCPSCETLRTGSPAIAEVYEPHLKKFVEIRSMPRLDGKKNLKGLIHIVRDISDKKELQQFIIEFEERFRALFNQASDCILLLDPIDVNSPVIIDANEAACRMHGYTWEELIGQPITILDAPEHWNHIPEKVQSLMKGEHVRFEVGHRRSDGSVFPVEVSARMITIGGKFYILAIDRDITERKQIESELQRHREQLMEMVEERTHELQKMNEQLIKEIEDRKRAQAEVVRASHLAALGELAAGIAHEINNPINGIINYSEILSNKYPPESPEHDISIRIIKEGDRIASIVKSLLSFARDSREEKHTVHVSDIIYDSLALTETHLRKDGIQLKIDIPPVLPYIYAQPQQIEQVFLNIISNARYSLNQKFRGAHDKKIFQITGGCIQKNGTSHVQVVFHDTGTGIPAHIIDRVMNPFFTTKPSNVGTGLGLSISHGIISDHGGTINIESAEGQYTKVIIDLPAKENKGTA